MTHCARPFQDCTSLCDQCSTPVRLTTINAKTRRAMLATSHQAIALAAVSFIIIFAAGYAGAALVNQGVHNIKEWKVQHEPV